MAPSTRLHQYSLYSLHPIRAPFGEHPIPVVFSHIHRIHVMYAMLMMLMVTFTINKNPSFVSIFFTIHRDPMGYWIPEVTTAPKADQISSEFIRYPKQTGLKSIKKPGDLNQQATFFLFILHMNCWRLTSRTWNDIFVCPTGKL